jgi:DNA invertase Pin-like site-specific DNA recombinase
VTEKRASRTAKSRQVFGQSRKQPEMFRAGLYARVSTNDQQTIPLQMRALREYTGKRLGRPMTAGLRAADIRKLHRAGISKSEIARRLQIAALRSAGFWPDLFLREIG